MPESFYPGPGFNVETFRSFLHKTGILRHNNFIVTLPMPAGMTGSRLNSQAFAGIGRYIQLACDTVTFPTTGARFQPIQRYGYGAFEQRPTIPRTTPLNCTFICDRLANMQKFFHEWAKIMVNYDFANGPFAGSTNSRGEGMAVYEISYKWEYAVDLQVSIYPPTPAGAPGGGQQGTPVRRVMFRDAFPAEVQEIPLSWGQRNSFIKIPVQFMYTDWFDLDVHHL